MLTLRLTQPGKKDLVFQVDSDEAVLGRVPDCDVVIPHSYVSKRHAKVMAGVVVFDLGSSNGTSVDGDRIDAPVLLGGRSFQLGTKSSDVRIEVEHEDSNVEASPQVLRVRQDLDTERRRAAELAAELSALRSASTSSATDPESVPLVHELRRERDDLARRLASLRQEIESRDVEASEGLQARLAGDALAEAQRSNEALTARVAELEAQAPGPTLEATKQALAGRVGELEADLAESTETVRRLQAELEQAQAAQQEPVGSDLFFKLQAENHELRKELLEAKSAPAEGSPELFVSLQSENQSLRERITKLEGAGPAAPEPAPPVPASAAIDAGELEELKHENHTLRMSKADLLAELELLRSRAQGAASTPATAGAGSSITELLSSLAADDIDDRPPLLEGALEPFLTLELFRFLRQVERVVTRMAGNFLQLFDQRTILPDTSGNVRALLGEVLVVPGDPKPREELVVYIEELGRWLVVALGANRRAAERFAEEIKSELSERNLTKDEPIASYKKLAGMRDAELWQRVSRHLKLLTSNVIEERLENLTSACAEELRREQDH